ncbi:hypothetical protein PoB_005780800 [Plakobranchus ocellatus]|uniref:Uncharacterized protein n=1 Tax=Plakobranchus ocellatus TaxID=259542 RepID=A0AAV4CJN4_9GAST|nr:hypothetical protein PoB_005780800 [Plakobranchus ocellatus]
MAKDMKEKVKEQHNKKSQPRQPLLQHEFPSRSFEKIAADVFHLDGQDFLLLADKMPFVKTLKQFQVLTEDELANDVPDMTFEDAKIHHQSNLQSQNICAQRSSDKSTKAL